MTLHVIWGRSGALGADSEVYEMLYVGLKLDLNLDHKCFHEEN